MVNDFEMKGTTVVAILFREGAFIAADRQVTVVLTLNRDYACDKIFPLDSHSVIAIAGVPGIAFAVIDSASEAIVSVERMMRKEVSFEGKARLLSHIIRADFQRVMSLQATAFYLLVGYDEEVSKARIVVIDPLGARYEVERYGAIGSGADRVHSFLDEKQGSILPQDLSRDVALERVVSSIEHAAKRNVATGKPEEGITIFEVSHRGIREAALGELPNRDSSKKNRGEKQNG